MIFNTKQRISGLTPLNYHYHILFYEDGGATPFDLNKISALNPRNLGINEILGRSPIIFVTENKTDNQRERRPQIFVTQIKPITKGGVAHKSS